MEIDWTPDKANSITSKTGRLIVDDERAVEVRPDAPPKVQIAAVMDLLDLHFSQVDLGRSVSPDRVTLRVPHLSAEARGALGTIIDSLVEPVRVRVLEGGPPDEWHPATVGWDLADVTEYSSWPGLLSRPRPVPSLVASIVTAVDSPALRAYPMLSTAARWSLRLGGLEVGRADATKVSLQVGKDGKGGALSLQRGIWVKATGHEGALVTGDVDQAAHAIRSFATAWHAFGEARADQDEHALESRILRGAAAITASGRPLSLLQSDPVVNWGSQFPTKWGPAGKSRYLDALLRDGSNPWAIEMKVQGATGVGQYYRHAVAQAVLYRQFIRHATPLHAWFHDRGLDATKCEAAVVVPRMTHPRQAQWRDRVSRMCQAFEVAFVEVDPKHARRH